MNGDVERFDRWAATYDQHRLQRIVFEPVQRTLLELAAAEMPRPGAILDVGCGTGRLLRAASERFPNARLEGIDAAQGMVEQARSGPPAGSPIHYQLATAEALPFGDAEFDLVFSTMTFHHWADQSRAMKEVARVLTPNGRWMLADFVPRGAMRYIRRLLRMRRFRERPELGAMLARAGLSIATARDVPGLMDQVPVLAIGRSAQPM